MVIFLKDSLVCCRFPYLTSYYMSYLYRMLHMCLVDEINSAENISDQDKINLSPLKQMNNSTVQMLSQKTGFDKFYFQYITQRTNTSDGTPSCTICLKLDFLGIILSFAKPNCRRFRICSASSLGTNSYN